MKAPIVSYKHQRNETVSYVGTSLNNTFTVLSGVGPGEAESPNQAAAGHHVYSMDVSVNFVTSSGTGSGDYSWFLVHLRSDQTLASMFPTPSSEWTTIGISKNRNQVIKSYMGVVGSEDGGIVRQNPHIKIPRIFQRIREGDVILLVFNGAEAGTLSIGARYKTYS